MSNAWKRLFVGAVGVALAAACAGPAAGLTPSAAPEVATLTAAPTQPPLEATFVLKPAALALTPAAGVTSTAAPSATLPPATPTELGQAVAPTLLPTASPTPALARRLPILEYHYSTFNMAADVQMQTEWFEAQLQWLADNDYVTLSSVQLADFVAGRWAPPARAVALTFDVGATHFTDYRTVIIPALRRLGMQAIFFVMPSQTQDDCAGDVACWPDLLAWRDEGLIAIESHSLTHYDYATLPPERLALDIAGSKRMIEAQTGQAVLGLCYPFDSLSAAAPELLRAAGYAYAVAGPTRRDRSAHFADATPFALPRYYPYSGAAFYPQIGGRAGPTFAEMLLAAGADEK